MKAEEFGRSICTFQLLWFSAEDSFHLRLIIRGGRNVSVQHTSTWKTKQTVSIAQLANTEDSIVLSYLANCSHATTV